MTWWFLIIDVEYLMHSHLETCIFPILSLTHCRFVGLSSKLSDMIMNEETSATEYRIQFGTFHIANYEVLQTKQIANLRFQFHHGIYWAQKENKIYQTQKQWPHVKYGVSQKRNTTKLHNKHNIRRKKWTLGKLWKSVWKLRKLIFSI